MKILFIGTVDLSLRLLEELVKIDVNIVGVCTKSVSPFNSDFFDLKPICDLNLIPCKYTDDINSKENLDWVESLKPDIIFCFGWSSLIKKDLMDLSPMGVVGYHPAELPKNRGRHPLVWAIVLGLKETASTFFFMDEGADSGDIILQKKIIITDHDDAQSLYMKMIDTAITQLLEIIPDLNNGNYQRIQQNHSKANVWRKRGKEDGKIDWRMGVKQVHNLVRGLARPYIGAHFMFKSVEHKVWKARVVNHKSVNNIEPGKIIKKSKNLLTIKCGDGCIELIEVTPPLVVDVGDYL